MRARPFALVLFASLLAAISGVTGARAAQTIAILDERQVALANGKGVQHFVRLKNTGAVPVRGLRVTVELQDYFGKLLWAGTASASPSAIPPGETAILSVTAPRLRDHSRTRYRFHYRPSGER